MAVMGLTPSLKAGDGLSPNPDGFSLGGEKIVCAEAFMVAVAEPPELGASTFMELRIQRDVAVVTILLVTQYTDRAAGTLKENQPIIRGRNLRMTLLCC